MRWAGWGMVVQEWARRWWPRWYDLADCVEVRASGILRAFLMELMARMGLDEEIEEEDAFLWAFIGDEVEEIEEDNQHI